MNAIKIYMQACLLFSISTICQAQWLNGTNGIYYSSGNVGIGTYTPQSPLQVLGEIKVTNSSNEGPALTLQNGSKTQSGIAKEWKIWNMTGLYGNSLQFWAYDQTGANGGLCTNRFTIMDNGNVGIGLGLTSPSVKLDVAGTIRAHEVKVCLNLGCDYVFDEDYELMNLNELSAFVKTNKHLPDVAPAAQMEAEGVNLSEMNALLLKKVEELTLYVIQQQEMLDKLNEKIEKLENEKK